MEGALWMMKDAGVEGASGTVGKGTEGSGSQFCRGVLCVAWPIGADDLLVLLVHA